MYVWGGGICLFSVVFLFIDKNECALFIFSHIDHRLEFLKVALNIDNYMSCILNNKINYILSPFKTGIPAKSVAARGAGLHTNTIQYLNIDESQYPRLSITRTN